MENIWKLIVDNKEWAFSGVGVMLISIVLGFVFKNKSDDGKVQKIKSGKNSTNIQGGDNSHITIGGNSDVK